MQALKQQLIDIGIPISCKDILSLTTHNTIDQLFVIKFNLEGINCSIEKRYDGYSLIIGNAIGIIFDGLKLSAICQHTLHFYKAMGQRRTVVAYLNFSNNDVWLNAL